MSDKQPDYPLTISLNVLEHLGINLYSNVPAVLSETVANAWDADASEVRVEWNKDDGTIVIQDDGIGMTPDDIVDRFLTVGYRRRDEQPGLTEKKRRPMGRKGIGKLSLFSVADIVDVETAKDGTKSAFRLDVSEIRKTIREQGDSGTCNAIHQPVSDIGFSRGTRITLRKLRRRLTKTTTTALKKRIARRFLIIGEEFRVIVNDAKVEPADRGYYDKIQYIWTYGKQDEVILQCTNLDKDPEDRTTQIDADELEISGWLATVREVKDLKDVDGGSGGRGDNLNRIAIFVRGKLAQEDMLADFSERGVYASYLIGELRVDDFDQYDGLDTTEDEDAATSSRQRIMEDDSRYRQLQDTIWKELKHIQQRWKELRAEEGVQTACSIPEVKEWLEHLPSGDQSKARDWLGRLNQIRISDADEQKNEQKSLIKHAVLAFEFYRSNKKLRKLENVSNRDIAATLKVFDNVDDIEKNLYGQIASQRVEVIRTLHDKVDNNALESMIQKYLFNHLWLLDPSWERVDSTVVMEKRVSKLFKEVEAKLSEEENLARLDIAYRKTAGQHVIIELKRPERTTTTLKIINQLDKYMWGMKKLLRAQDISHEPVEFIVLLGKPPSDWSDHPDKARESIAQLRSSYNARIVFYDKLLADAYKAYKDYIEHNKSVTYLSNVIRAIENYAPPTP